MPFAWFKDAYEGMVEPCVHNGLGLIDGQRQFKYSGIGGYPQKAHMVNQLRPGQAAFQPGSTRFMLDCLRVVGVEQ